MRATGAGAARLAAERLARLAAERSERPGTVLAAARSRKSPETPRRGWRRRTPSQEFGTFGGDGDHHRSGEILLGNALARFDDAVEKIRAAAGHGKNTLGAFDGQRHVERVVGVDRGPFGERNDGNLMLGASFVGRDR